MTNEESHSKLETITNELKSCLENPEGMAIHLQNQLKEEKDRYNRIIDATNAGTWEWNVQTTELKVNERWATMLGYSLDELFPITLETWERLTHPEDLANAQAQINRVLSGKEKRYIIEFRMKHKNGNWIWVESKGGRVSEASSEKAQMIYGTHFDVTHRKKTFELLAQSEDRLRKLFDQAPIGYQALDAGGFFVDVNQQWLNLLGYKKEEVIGKWFGDFLSPKYRDAFRKQFPIFKAKGEIHNEFEMVHKNGDKIYIAFNGKIAYEGDGSFKQTHCMLQDITQQKKWEDKLLETEDRYKAITNASMDGYFVASREGNFLECNDAFTEMCGYPRNRLFDMRIQSIFFANAGEEIRVLIRQIVEQQHGQFTVKLKRVDGNELDVEVSAVYSEKEKRGLAFVHDITKREIARKALEISEKRYSSYVENAPDGIFITDRDGRYVEVNAAASITTGYSKEELLEMSTSSFAVKASQAKGNAQFKTVVEQGVAVGEPIQYRRKDGSLGWWIINAVKLSEDRMLGFTKDVTKMVEAQEQLTESQKRLIDAQAIAHLGDWKLDLATNLMWASEEAFNIYGIERVNEYIPLDIAKDRVTLEYRELLNEKLAALIAGKDKYNVEFTIKKANTQEECHIHSIAILQKDENGNPNRVIGTIQDITEKKQQEKELLENEKKFRKAIDESPIPVMLRAEDGEILELNRAWSDLTGYQLCDIPTVEMWIEKAYEKNSLHMKEVIESQYTLEKKKHIGEYPVKTKTGAVLIWDFYSSMIGKLKDGRKIVMSVAIDITEEKEKQNERIYMSFHDHLTGLYNRRFFEEELSRLNTSRNLPITIALFDVNGLKLINDSFGHDAGDQLLVKSADVFTACCRADDLVARHGGDEFVIILPKTSSDEAELVMNRIKKRIEKEQVESISISISYGHETKTKNEQDILEIFKSAEDHMYRHKLYESGSTRSKTVDLIINTLYEKNNREMLHSKRVSELCEQTAKALNMKSDDINQMRVAGLMHDIGKIGIDEKVLNKAGELTESEWEELKRHSEIGYRILSSVNEFSEIAEFVLEHQERWDGTGYPKGLKGEEISIEARIIAIADAYDAMTGKRTYRGALSKKEAIEEIKKCAGTQFDPMLTKIFLEQVQI